jgi:hypothetical protein
MLPRIARKMTVEPGNRSRDVQSARRCLEESEVPSTDVATAAAGKAMLEPTGLALDLAQRRREHAAFLAASDR